MVVLEFVDTIRVEMCFLYKSNVCFGFLESIEQLLTFFRGESASIQ